MKENKAGHGTRSGRRLHQVHINCASMRSACSHLTNAQRHASGAVGFIGPAGRRSSASAAAVINPSQSEAAGCVRCGLDSG